MKTHMRGGGFPRARVGSHGQYSPDRGSLLRYLRQFAHIAKGVIYAPRIVVSLTVLACVLLPVVVTQSSFFNATAFSAGLPQGNRANLALQNQRDASGPVVVEIRLDGIVQPVSAEYVEHGIGYANRIHAAAVLLELSTPGGLGVSMRGIIESIFSSQVPVITYVAPSGSRAASAGFFILLAGDLAAMAPGTNTGAAHPVLLSGADVGKTEAAKMENDAAAYIRSIAGQRGRNPQLAEAGVRESKSYTDREALSGHLIDAIASTPEEIFKQFDGRTIKRINGSSVTVHLASARLDDYQMNSREQFLSRLADPNLAFILGAIGVILLYFEFTHPGMVLPGIGGAIAVVLALLGFNLLPINYVGAALIVLAIVLFALEARITAHGLLAAGGVIAMLFGSLILIKTPWPGPHIHISTSLAVTLPVAVIIFFLVRAAVLALRQKTVTGPEGLVGTFGVARTDLVPAGKVLVHGELWDARASATVKAGETIRVQAVEGFTLVVDRCSGQE
ncbi:MAG TPA: nodulation protein NfeD [Terriglobia bacterium]|nr:nodulation protein NfeD [Terriglobia bacterium]